MATLGAAPKLKTLAPATPAAPLVPGAPASGANPLAPSTPTTPQVPGTPGGPPLAPTSPPFARNPFATVGQAGYDYFKGYDDIGQLFFNQNPDQAWSHAWSQLAPNSAAPWWNWGRQQENRYEDRYASEAALPGNANLTFSDFINRHAPEFRTEFDNLPANQRGVNLFWMPQGRLG